MARAGADGAVDRSPCIDPAERDPPVVKPAGNRHGLEFQAVTRRGIERPIGSVVGCRCRDANQRGVDRPDRLIDRADLDEAAKPDGPPRREAPCQPDGPGRRPGIEGVIVRAGDVEFPGEFLPRAAELGLAHVERRPLLYAADLHLYLQGLVGAEHVAVPPARPPGRSEVGVVARTRFEPSAWSLFHGDDDRQRHRPIAGGRLAGNAHRYGTEQLRRHQPLLVGVECAPVERAPFLPRPVGQQIRFPDGLEPDEPDRAEHGEGPRRKGTGHRDRLRIRVGQPIPPEVRSVRIALAVQRCHYRLLGPHDRTRARCGPQRRSQCPCIELRETDGAGRVEHQGVLTQGIGGPGLQHERHVGRAIRWKADVGIDCRRVVALRAQQAFQATFVMLDAPQQADAVPGAASLQPECQQGPLGQLGDRGRWRTLDRRRVAQGPSRLGGRGRRAGVVQTTRAADQAKQGYPVHHTASRRKATPGPLPNSRSHQCRRPLLGFNPGAQRQADGRRPLARLWPQESVDYDPWPASPAGDCLAAPDRSATGPIKAATSDTGPARRAAARRNLSVTAR